MMTSLRGLGSNVTYKGFMVDTLELMAEYYNMR